MKTVLLILLSVFLYTNLPAQQDPEAKRILDLFSEKMQACESYKASFSMIYENKQNSDKQVHDGIMLCQKDKYRLELGNSIIFNDGVTLCNYLKDANEVNISDPKKKKSDDFMNNPTSLFSIYSKDFKFSYLGETNSGKTACFEVDLYPNDLKRSYSIVKLLISKETYQLSSAMIKLKSGENITILIESLQLNAPVSPKDFTFDKKDFPNVEIIDMR